MRVLFSFRPYNESLLKYGLIKLSHRLSLGVWQFGVELPRAHALRGLPLAHPPIHLNVSARGARDLCTRTSTLAEFGPQLTFT